MNAAAPDIAGKIYIVTGASRGVGHAITKVLHARGARFGMLARAEEELRSHAAEYGEAALPVRCDVSDKASVDEAVARVAEHFGGLDGIINNAGISRIAPVERLTEKDMIDMFRVNVLGTLFPIQAALPHLRQRGGGNIVNISSASVRYMDEFPFLGGYASSKIAVERLTEELRAEVSRDNIAVTLFSLGSTLTYFGTGWAEDIATEAFAEWSARGGMAPATMDPSFPAEAIVRCLETPHGACPDFIQFRPFHEQPKGPMMAG